VQMPCLCCRCCSDGWRCWCCTADIVLTWGDGGSRAFDLAAAVKKRGRGVPPLWLVTSLFVVAEEIGAWWSG